MSVFERLTKKYSGRDLYDHRKAEYSIGFVIILSIITITLTILKASLVGVTNLEMIISVVNLIVFAIIFTLIYFGKINLGVWILIIAGVSRVVTVYMMYDILHFYILITLILIASSFIHYKKAQYHFVNTSLLSVSLYNTVVVFMSYNDGEVTYENAIISLVSSFYLIAMMYMISVFVRNTDKEIQITDSLKDMATKDYLTNTYNRRKLDTVIEEQSEETSYSILIFDFDYFKNINDEFGHIAGDTVLKESLNIIKNTIRKDDIIVRFGGEEFVVVLRACDKANVEEVAKNVCTSISNHHFDCIGGKQVTISIGATSMTENEGIYQAINRADDALYIAKENGRNNVVVKFD